MSRLQRLWLPVAAASLVVLDDCGPVDKIGSDITCGTATYNLPGGTFVSFGTSADARKIDAFLKATIDLNRAVNEMHDTTLAACRAIGDDLGIPASEYVAMGNEPQVAATCRRVVREVSTILRAALPTGARLDVVVSPPVCRVDLQFSANCVAQCTAQASVMVPTCNGTVVADCAGSCDALCSGSCSGGCTGSCAGTCTGSCSGNCYGTCMGACATMDAVGRCAGRCTGTCSGSCSAGCTGTCSGSCSAGCMGTCMGQCRGMCSVASNIRCDGTWDARADAQCQAACRAQASAVAVCERPQVSLAASAMVNAQSVARLNTLLMSLQRNYPAIVLAGQRGATITTQGLPAFASSVQGAADAAGRVSASAAACIVRAGIDAANIATRFQASVQVSVDFSAAVTVQGG